MSAKSDARESAARAAATKGTRYDTKPKGENMKVEGKRTDLRPGRG